MHTASLDGLTVFRTPPDAAPTPRRRQIADCAQQCGQPADEFGQKAQRAYAAGRRGSGTAAPRIALWHCTSLNLLFVAKLSAFPCDGAL